MSTTALVAVSDQFASGRVRDECTALAHVGLPDVEGLSDADVSDAESITLVENPVTGLLLLRATDSAESLSKALHVRCGIALSTRLSSVTNANYCIRWMSPDCWLLSCPLHEAFAIENDLRKAVSGLVAIVNVSGGYGVLELAGSHAREVLMKSSAYDTHSDHFPEGKVVNTTFAKAQVTLRCVELSKGQGRYELIIRRSFCDYVWLWLQRASAEYGLRSGRR